MRTCLSFCPSREEPASNKALATAHPCPLSSTFLKVLVPHIRASRREARLSRIPQALLLVRESRCKQSRPAGHRKQRLVGREDLSFLNRKSSLRVLYPLLTSRQTERQKGSSAHARLSQTLERNGRATFQRQRYERSLASLSPLFSARN